MASNFRGDWAFLSNFYECKIVYEGYTFNNAESAFQAQKCLTDEEKWEFAYLSAAKAKRKDKFSFSVSSPPQITKKGILP